MVCVTAKFSLFLDRDVTRRAATDKYRVYQAGLGSKPRNEKRSKIDKTLYTLDIPSCIWIVSKYGRLVDFPILPYGAYYLDIFNLQVSCI